MQFPELKYNFDYYTIELDGNISIAYIDEGDKESSDVLLFVHGLSSYIPAWQKLIPLLKNSFRCIAIDLPGYAKSSSGVYSGSMVFYAEIIAGFIKKLKLQKVTLTGHSMGGHISIVTALEYPSLIERLVLLAPAGFETFTEKDRSRMARNNVSEIYAATSDRQIRMNYKSNFFKMPKDAEPMIQDRIAMKGWKNFDAYCKVVANSFNGMLDRPVLDDLHLIKQPTLIMYGCNDKFIPHPILHKQLTVKEVAETGAVRIAGSKLVLVNECGHFLPFEKEKEAAVEILEFFGKNQS